MKSTKGKKSMPRIVQPLKRQELIQDESSHGFDIDAVDELELNKVLAQLKKKKIAKPVLAEKSKKHDPKRRYTDDGVPIYSADELHIGKSGSGKTDLCPFDCDCCF